MRAIILISMIVLGLVIVGETAYLASDWNQSRVTRETVYSTVTDTSTQTYTATNSQTSFAYGLIGTSEVSEACSYLVSNYNASLGLVSETPSHERYWLYSDNFLALMVLNNPCNQSAIAEKIKTTLSLYPSYPNQFMALNSTKWNFNSSKNYNLSGVISTTINNQSGVLSPDQYADIAFLQAFYYAKWENNSTQAMSLFFTGAKMYNGIGFNDTPFQKAPEQGIYQTYKLALYIFVGGMLNQSVPLSALVNLDRMQSSTGGFYTGYSDNFSSDGTTTNAETTSLAIMALESL